MNILKHQENHVTLDKTARELDVIYPFFLHLMLA